ncbi:hypothetical protein Taro_009654 [Colocasia esculenta]|uniref:Myb-like domain-containing protein n=1 Tax=Colocasia esculenta TaxID=4460 RepID=A0A843U5H6_COLES|nr:hypothetical protein [Colocasia esculenta]
MYLSEKPRPVDYYKEEGRDIVMEMVGNGELSPAAAAAPPPLPQQLPQPQPLPLPQPQPQQSQAQQQPQMVLGESSGEDHEVKAPKKRAETWVQEETRNLVGFRRDMDGLFNTSKSNKHLWEQISAKMRDKGFDRSPTMCTDKWRNLLKEFKKSKQQGRAGGGPPRMSCYKEIDELLKERNKNGNGTTLFKSPTTPSSRVDSFLQFSDKGLEDAGIPFESVEGYNSSIVLYRHCRQLQCAMQVVQWQWHEV